MKKGFINSKVKKEEKSSVIQNLKPVAAYICDATSDILELTSPFSFSD